MDGQDQVVLSKRVTLSCLNMMENHLMEPLDSNLHTFHCLVVRRVFHAVKRKCEHY